ncbi:MULTISPECIES: hypothetical protein [unclassified Bradyrhizobium]|uniref:hypothetical protein n=1 Tax=unclassified Bradyrhizobium TaxID=2631580 RepID=UPI00291615A5|nr:MULTISPECIES: hypothetical protein [unclassified Bradyrhizobium]
MCIISGRIAADDGGLMLREPLACYDLFQQLEVEFMTRTVAKTLAASLVLSMAAMSAGSAQSFSEPAAFQAMHPDRDVLNGGALTPEALMRREHQMAPLDATAGPTPVVPRRPYRRRH